MSLRSFMHQAKNLQVYSYCICGCSAWKSYNTIIILHECVIVIVASFAFHSHWEINGILDRLKGWIQKFIENILLKNIRNVDDATRFLEHLASKINEDLMQALAYEVYIFNTIASHDLCAVQFQVNNDCKQSECHPIFLVLLFPT